MFGRQTGTSLRSREVTAHPPLILSAVPATTSPAASRLRPPARVVQLGRRLHSSTYKLRWPPQILTDFRRPITASRLLCHAHQSVANPHLSAQNRGSAPTAGMTFLTLELPFISPCRSAIPPPPGFSGSSRSPASPSSPRTRRWRPHPTSPHRATSGGHSTSATSRSHWCCQAPAT